MSWTAMTGGTGGGGWLRAATGLSKPKSLVYAFLMSPEFVIHSCQHILALTWENRHGKPILSASQRVFPYEFWFCRFKYQHDLSWPRQFGLYV